MTTRDIPEKNKGKVHSCGECLMIVYSLATTLAGGKEWQTRLIKVKYTLAKGVPNYV